MRCAAAFRSLLLLIGVAWIAQTSQAQGDPNLEAGLKPYQVYSAGNIDNINLSNGQLSVDIPLISYPQKGGKLSMEFGLHYINTGDWGSTICPEEDYCYFSGQNGLQHGFTFVIKNVPGATFVQNNDPIIGYCDVYLSLEMPDGATHQMAPLSATQWESVDASGFNASMSQLTGCGLQYPTIVDPNGIRYSGKEYPIGENVGSVTSPYLGFTWFGKALVPSLITDTNGNSITTNLVFTDNHYELSSWTDSVQRPIPAFTTADVSSCPSTPIPPDFAISWNPPGVSGGTYPILFCFTQVVETDPVGSWDGYGNPLPWSYETAHLQSVVLPNPTYLTAWTFQYSGDVNNDLTQITFPTGGTLQYTWGGNGGFFANSSYCSNIYANNVLALRNVLTRTLNPVSGGSVGQWQYNYSNLSSNLTMTVTDAVGNYSTHTFQPFNTCSPYETKVQYYQAGGSLLKTVDTTYNYTPNPSALFFGPVALGVVPYTVKTTWPNGQESQTVSSYDTNEPVHTSLFSWGNALYGTPFTSTYGRLLTKAEYDYGSGSPGALIRTNTTIYQAFQSAGYLANNLLDLPYQVQVIDANQNTQSNTQYNYDENNGSPQCVCGNQTSVKRWLNTSGSYLTTQYVYNGNGMPVSMTDPKTNPPTNYSYDSTGAFLYEIQYPTPSSGVAQTEYFNYDSSTGLLNSHTDRNNQTTSYSYTNMLWPQTISYPDGGETDYTYNSATQFTISQKIDNQGHAPKLSYGLVDGLGRKSRWAVSNGANYDQVDICYDADGRVFFQSYPYAGDGLPGSAACTGTSHSGNGDTFGYDGLSRVTSVTHSDGGVISTSYLGTCAYGAAPYSAYVITLVTDEQSKTRQSCTDGAGRLAAVVEDPGGLNLGTIYSYDVLDDLTSVVQSNSRNRMFTYDSLSRLLTAFNPESGNTCYGTLSGQSCLTNGYDANGNLLYKTDARGSTTAYLYDALNRLTQKTYWDGTTPGDYYYYDQAGWTYPVGRLTTQGTFLNLSWFTTAGFSYDKMGRRVFENHYANGPSNGIVKSTTYSYSLLGGVTSLQYPSGNTISYLPLDAEGRPTQAIDSANSVNYVTNARYNPAGSLCSMVLGSTITSTWTFNSRWQPQRIQATTSGAPSSPCASPTQTGNIFDINYYFNQTSDNCNPTSGDNGNVMSIANNRDSSRSQLFCYDALNRIKSAHTNATWGESYGIDPWSNLYSIGAFGGLPQPENLAIGMGGITASNQFPGSMGYGYDLAGNMTHDASHQYSFDAKNQIIQVSQGVSASYVYDVDGRRVQKVNGTIYWYGTDGEVLDESDSSGNISNEYIFFNGKRVARRGQ